jgi:serine/threonine-protein kinase
MAAPDSPSNDPIDALRAALGAHYTVERRLGQGGMGSVYLARDNTLDRPVAIKVINPDVASSETTRARFLQEARTVAKLRHPNIVPVFAAGETNGVLYFAMDYVPGESLRDVMARDGRLEEARATQVLREIAMALDHAHSLGLVHRDIKPENILLDADSGRAMLTDFGVSRAFEKDGGLTQTGMILGSPRYMSPEQASGDRAIDGRSDLYSLGLVGYEMLTGAPVVQSGTVASMLVKHLTETPAPIAEKVTGISANVAAAIDRAMAKDPSERWQTGREFAEAVAGADVVVTSARRSSAPRPVRTRIAIAAGVGVAIAAGALWMLFGRTTGTAYLVTPFEIQSGEASVRWLREGSVNMLTLTLGQWSDLNVINYERTLSLLDAAELGDKERLSLDDARGLARRGNAGTVVMGQVLTTRDSLLVTAKLFDVRSGRALQEAKEGAALGDDPRPLYDRLAQDLLSIAGGPTTAVQLAQATTTSIEAYRAYLEGVKLLNSWRLPEADAAFVRATTIDSTFALAYHKRSLGLGWSEATGIAYRASAERAQALASRLPAREQAMVKGHYHLVRAMNAIGQRDTTTARAEFAASIASYRDLLARDSLVAEAWYGLADGYYHARSVPMSLDTSAAYATRSLRGFHRTLAIDSTFHLAYSHLVQLYNNASSPQSNLVIANDSAFFTSARTGDTTSPAGVLAQRQRAEARRRGVAISQAWMRADPQSAQPVVQLAQSYDAAGQRDSAFAVLRGALARPISQGVALRMVLLQMQVQNGDTGVVGTLRDVLNRYTGDSLRRVSVNQRISANGFMIAAAAMTGNASDVDRAIALFVDADSTFPGSPVPTATTLDLYRRALHMAMGEPITEEAKTALVRAMRGLDEMPGPIGAQGREGSQSLPLLGLLATRDTIFAPFLRRWSGGALGPEIDALIALNRGDTAKAEQIARAFPSADSLRQPGVRFGAGGMRTISRAEILAGIGFTRQAAEVLEAFDPSRVNRASLAEPGYTVWVRSFLTRARLWKQLGERERAIAAYESFIQRWQNADGAAAKQVHEAKAELAQLRDTPPTQGTTKRQ